MEAIVEFDYQAQHDDELTITVVRSSPTSGRRMEAGGRDRSMAGEVCSLTTL